MDENVTCFDAQLRHLETPKIMQICDFRRLEDGVHHPPVQDRYEYLYGPFGINGLIGCRQKASPDPLRPQTQNFLERQGYGV